MEAAGAQLLCTIDRLAIMGLVEVLRPSPFLSETPRTDPHPPAKGAPRPDRACRLPRFQPPDCKNRPQAGDSGTLLYQARRYGPGAREGRKKIARLADRMAVVFPFEVDFYADQPIEVEFVGHPLMEVIGNVEET